MRTLSKDKYIFAGLITLAIFLLGLFLGLIIEEKRVQYIQKEARLRSLDFNSLQLQYAYIDQLSQENNCNAVSKTFDTNLDQLEEARIKLENFDANAKINKKEFEILKREYIQAQLRYWLLSKKRKELCNDDTVSLLYFFSDAKTCPECDNQAFVLTYLKLRFKNKLLNFIFDSKVRDEPMIELLRKAYNIRTYPTIIIENKIFEGFTSKEKLLEEICSYYKDKLEDCRLV